MKSLNWSALVPPGGPAPVETARKSVEALRAKVDQARSDVESAQAAVRAAEDADQAAMARELRDGKEPVSSTEKIEALRAAAAEAQRRAGALNLAIAQSEAELAEAIGKSPEKWARDVAERGERAREQSCRSLDELAQALDDLRAQRAIADLPAEGHGFDNGQPLRTMHVGHAPGSRGASASLEPFTARQLVGWLREVVDRQRPRRSRTGRCLRVRSRRAALSRSKPRRSRSRPSRPPAVLRARPARETGNVAGDRRREGNVDRTGG